MAQTSFGALPDGAELVLRDHVLRKGSQGLSPFLTWLYVAILLDNVDCEAACML